MTTTTTTAAAWAYLNRVIEGPSQALFELTSAGHSAEEIAHAVRTRASWIGKLGEETQRRYTWDQPEKDIHDAAQHGYELLTPDHPHWPREQIAYSFGKGVYEALQNDETRQPRPDGHPPHALWVRGNTNLAQLLKHSLAVVGTRATTSYGHRATQELVRGLRPHGLTIVSGGALGIDTVAHEAALEAQLPTIVIAACGPGICYPKRNERLFDRIVAAGGAIITEYAPGLAPERHRFLTRNRLVAGLTNGTLVVEAAYRSGALSTMRWAQYYQRKTMAVPGPITGSGSVGTNLAIFHGHAELVMNADQVIDTLGPVAARDPEEALKRSDSPSPIQLLSRDELRVFDAAPPLRISDEHTHGKTAERLADETALPLQRTINLLIDLQEKGLIQRTGNQWARANYVAEELS